MATKDKIENNITKVISLLQFRHHPFTDTDFTYELSLLYSASVALSEYPDALPNIQNPQS